MGFNPSANSEIILQGVRYTVEAHPNAVGMPYIAEGGRATVYKLKTVNAGDLFALKVFKKRYRTSEQVAVARGLSEYSSHRGLRAAERIVVEPSDDLAQRFPELQYAVVMPWIQGTTWYDLLVRASQSPSFRLEPRVSIALAANFLTAMESLEQLNFAHTDIASGNVVVDLARNETHLLDLEDAYFPGASRAVGAGIGTPGYRHEPTAAAGGAWAPWSDRHAAAVLAAEMILLSLHSLTGIGDSGLFGPHPLDPSMATRLAELRQHGHDFAPRLTEAVLIAFVAKELQDCPTLGQLASAARLDLAALDGAQSAVLWDAIPARQSTLRTSAPTMMPSLNGAEKLARRPSPTASMSVVVLVAVALITGLAAVTGAVILGGMDPLLKWLLNRF